MQHLPAAPIPEHYERIVLVNPTRYLGNLLIAGGLIQAFQQHCIEHRIRFFLVVDERYRDLMLAAFPQASLLFYPRGELARNRNLWTRLRRYMGFLARIRRLRTDIAFNIEEDSVSHRLTQLSGARFRLGCSTIRHKRGYQHVVPVDFSSRPVDRKHRWFSFYEVFRVLGLQAAVPGYIRLRIAPDMLKPALLSELEKQGIDFNLPLIAIHAGATKVYKKWPLENYSKLSNLLLNNGFQPVFVGAGSSDEQMTQAIMKQIKVSPAPISPVNLCNHLNLFELAVFFTRITGIIGNDSGPFHLASALGIPGTVLFGPTDVDIWRPLNENSIVIKGTELCSPQCTRSHCIYEHRCLKSISPEMVIGKILLITKRYE